MLRLKFATLALAMTMGMGGCIHSPTAPIPGAANTFDSNCYLTLVTTDSVIQTSKADLANGKFPASIAGNVKAALNGLIQAYNIANTTYQGYHAAVVANQTPSPQFSATQVTNALNSVQTATTTLIAAKGGN